MLTDPLNVNKVKCRVGICASEEVTHDSAGEIELAEQVREEKVGKQTPLKQRNRVGALEKTLRYLEVLKGQTMQMLLLGIREPFVQSQRKD